ncbi:hypothetical protein D1631_06755 [Chryseobacterium nematophagum]|uniref:PorT family protein n=1 Tax=Chryseobacterium nematophagum TaxID=2305228 RepID=A0A3M7TFH6_9FLAO|nr:hypothetical protein [Chryseobacterium nematophagum]RNA61647.1 hypothetical protein D1631_06755 [Chryseobacterium nematophagum]
MRKAFLALLLFFVFFTNAQIKFEKGYLITTNDEKKEVLIKNMDWINTPTGFSYKTDQNSTELTGIPSNIKEFGIYNSSKYISYTGSIDYSSDNTTELSSKYEPELTESSVFLKEETVGTTNLYSYKGKNVIRFFYSNTHTSITPLINKKYYLEGNTSKIATNNSYIGQLKDLFSDDSNALTLINQTKYNTSDLKKLFNVYNKTENVASSELKEKTKFNLHIRPGINFYSSLGLKGSIFDGVFPSKSSFRIGVEAEAVLPFNKNKWSIIFEPTYSAYSGKTITVKSNSLYEMSLDSYSFITLPIGIRHYMFINDKSKIFVNGQANVLTLRSGKAKNFDLLYSGQAFEKVPLSTTQTFKSLSFGIGYNYNNKYSIEFRYNTNNNIIEDTTSQTADIKYASIILGYNIF